MTRVDFYDGGTYKGTDTTSSYTYSWTFTSADNGTHNWTARAYDAAGNSSTSSVVSLTVNIGYVQPNCTEQSFSAAAVSSSQINLSWTDNSSNESGFKIERSTSATSGFSQIATVGANATSYSNSGLSASTTYYYRVRAYNSAGDSGYSNTASATTQGTTITVPDAPTNLTASAVSSSQINLTWQDNSTNEEGFHIWRSFTSGLGPDCSCWSEYDILCRYRLKCIYDIYVHCSCI